MREPLVQPLMTSGWPFVTATLFAGESTVNTAATPPKLTALAPLKLLPLMRIWISPTVLAALGDRLLIDGALAAV